jgi:lactate permease
LDTTIVITAFVLLLAGALYFNKIWLGALLGAMLMLVYQATTGSDGIILAFGNAATIATELLLLIFGAFLFYNTLQSRQHFEPLIKQFSGSGAKLEVLLFFSIFFGSFLEGVAGFGIPAMLIAPILLSLGYKPLTSITIPLIANSTSVLFGALGTPLIVGLQQTGVSELIPKIISINVLPIMVLPFVLTYIYKRTEKEEIHVLKWSPKLLATGLIFIVPFVATSLISIELPSVVAGLVGMLVFSSAIMPKALRPSFGLWEKFLRPYALFLVLLLIARFLLIESKFNIAAGLKTISFYQPGIVFIIAVILINLLQKKVENTILIEAKKTAIKLQKTALTIVLLVLFAQIIQTELSQSLMSLMNSENNTFAAPFLGALGSFTLGSATMSNLIFSGALESVTVSQSLLLLALLHSGSCVGNVISLQNILMVNSIMPQSSATQSIFKMNIRWFGIYLGLIGLGVLILRIT